MSGPTQATQMTELQSQYGPTRISGTHCACEPMDRVPQVGGLRSTPSTEPFFLCCLLRHEYARQFSPEVVCFCLI